MVLYLYALAAVIAGIGIMAVYRQTLDALIDKPDQIMQIQTRFFTRIAMVEFIPLVLLVAGFAFGQGQEVPQIHIIISTVVVIIILCYNLFFTFSQRAQMRDYAQRTPIGKENERVTAAINVLSMITLAFSVSIPLIAIIFIFLTLS
ncbi:hypothetical protein [Gracilibacillus alcaliphilus]|uniref:hypothetical protein n=1 Tax=Gracilibacillus alcaliphilus TaxID=1401441 RepID=UPI0019587547|nr:hypothetical protein [Gracilibacillus alcaliphilus]MBM7675519.1 F0F1-type ATP synthase membrane subunit c/vacuolar-type H+-ATPase subunit K [Gracilibacillus alcaliphilus]